MDLVLVVVEADALVSEGKNVKIGSSSELCGKALNKE